MLVVVGRVGRAHGIRGELNVEPRTDEPGRRFAPGSSVVCQARVLTVRSARSHGGKLIVAFNEITDRTDAEGFHGALVEAEVDPDELPSDDDAFYDHQLVGLAVHQDETVRGRVTSVLHLPGQDTLVIDVDGVEVLVPFVSELVPQVNLQEGFLVVASMRGLLDPAAADEVR